MHSFLQDAPQLALQIYILAKRPSATKTERDYIITGKSLVPEFVLSRIWFDFFATVFVQCFSSLTSLVSLGWSLTSYQRTVRYSMPHKPQISVGGSASLFLWHVFQVASRVLALSLFANEYKMEVFIVLGVHYAVMTAWILAQVHPRTNQKFLNDEETKTHQKSFDFLLFFLFFLNLNKEDQFLRGQGGRKETVRRVFLQHRYGLGLYVRHHQRESGCHPHQIYCLLHTPSRRECHLDHLMVHRRPNPVQLVSLSSPDFHLRFLRPRPVFHVPLLSTLPPRWSNAQQKRNSKTILIRLIRRQFNSNFKRLIYSSPSLTRRGRTNILQSLCFFRLSAQYNRKISTYPVPDGSMLVNRDSVDCQEVVSSSVRANDDEPLLRWLNPISQLFGS